MELIRYKGNFVQCKEQIENAGQEIVTAQQGMLDRIEKGANSYYKGAGCWHPEGTARINNVNYWCLGEFVPTTNYPQETLNANEIGRYLKLKDEIKLGKKPASQVIKEIAEQDSNLPDYKKRVLIPNNQEFFSCPSDSLGDVDIAVFLARNPKIAEDYGRFLKEECGINQVNFYQITNDENNVASGFWLHRLGYSDDSGFVGDDRYLNDDSGSLFGVAKR